MKKHLFQGAEVYLECNHVVNHVLDTRGHVSTGSLPGGLLGEMYQRIHTFIVNRVAIVSNTVSDKTGRGQSKLVRKSSEAIERWRSIIISSRGSNPLLMTQAARVKAIVASKSMRLSEANGITTVTRVFLPLLKVAAEACCGAQIWTSIGSIIFSVSHRHTLMGRGVVCLTVVGHMSNSSRRPLDGIPGEWVDSISATDGQQW